MLSYLAVIWRQFSARPVNMLIAACAGAGARGVDGSACECASGRLCGPLGSFGCVLGSESRAHGGNLRAVIQSVAIFSDVLEVDINEERFV